MSQCQCPYRAWPTTNDSGRCAAEITQEDMLCDACRVTVWCRIARGVDASVLLDERS